MSCTTDTARTLEEMDCSELRESVGSLISALENKTKTILSMQFQLDVLCQALDSVLDAVQTGQLDEVHSLVAKIKHHKAEKSAGRII